MFTHAFGCLIMPCSVYNGEYFELDPELNYNPAGFAQQPGILNHFFAAQRGEKKIPIVKAGRKKC